MYEAHEEKNTMAADSALDYSAKSINLQMGSIQDPESVQKKAISVLEANQINVTPCPGYE